KAAATVVAAKAGASANAKTKCRAKALIGSRTITGAGSRGAQGKPITSAISTSTPACTATIAAACRSQEVKPPTIDSGPVSANSAGSIVSRVQLSQSTCGDTTMAATTTASQGSSVRRVVRASLLSTVKTESSPTSKSPA